MELIHMSAPTKWDSLGNDRLITQLDHNIFIIKPSNGADNMSLFCPVCHIIMDISLDAHAYRLFQCCEPCARTWAYANADLWHQLWRPSESDIIENVKKRNKRSLGFNPK